MIKHLLLSLSILLSASIIYPQTGWFWQNPLPQGNGLNKASYVSESIVYVSGAGGTLMKSTNGGVNFSTVTTGITENLSVDFINELTGFSVSGNGILRTLDGGLNWQYYSIDVHFIRQLFYQNESNIYLIGVKYVVNESDINTVYKSTDLGQTWNSVFEVQQTARVNSIFFINQFTGFAAGRKLAVPPGNISKIYKTTNGGTVWDVGDSIFTRPDFRYSLPVTKYRLYIIAR